MSASSLHRESTDSLILCHFQNTFQTILVTDEIYSYAILVYKCGLMEWDSSANIGYTANGDRFDNHDPSSRDVACENSPDSDWNNVIYLLSDANPEDQPPSMYTIFRAILCVGR